MNPIFIISGHKSSGKTTFLLNVMTLLKSEGYTVGGFVALHNFDADNYLIKEINTNKQILLMQRIAHFEQRPHHFELFRKGVDFGNNCIKDLLIDPPNIAALDEIGRYELFGELWSSGFTKLIESHIPLIFTTKEKYIEEVVKRWKIDPTLVFYPSDFDKPQEVTERIKRFL